MRLPCAYSQGLRMKDFAVFCAVVELVETTDFVVSIRPSVYSTTTFGIYSVQYIVFVLSPCAYFPPPLIFPAILI